MTKHRIHVCPACQQRVGRSSRTVGGVRYHLECYVPRGRPPSERGGSARIVGVRLTEAEAADVDDEAARRGLTAAGELRRRAFG